MDALIKWISERLAERSSRRGFFSTMEKALLSAAVIVTGQGFSARSSDAAQPAEAQSLECCDRRSRVCSSGTVCPSGSSVGYTWSCHIHDGSHYYCNDCYDDVNPDIYVCSYALRQGSTHA